MPKSVEEYLKDIPLAEREDILRRFNVSGGGSKSNGVTSAGGRLGYRHPIDDKSSVEVGASGHYVKGKDFKDVGIDRGDVTYERKLANDALIRATLGAGRDGIDSGYISYEKEFKKGGKVKSKPKVRGHGIERKGKTKGRFV
jgi:hypothetical protein